MNVFLQLSDVKSGDVETHRAIELPWLLVGLGERVYSRTVKFV